MVKKCQNRTILRPLVATTTPIPIKDHVREHICDDPSYGAAKIALVFYGIPNEIPPASFSLIADGDLQVIDDQLEQVLKK